MMESGQLFGGHEHMTGFPDVPADRFPSLAACGPYLADCDFDEQFEFGLELMLEGIRARIGAA
jgi:hypothetical protein